MLSYADNDNSDDINSNDATDSYYHLLVKKKNRNAQHSITQYSIV